MGKFSLLSKVKLREKQKQAIQRVCDSHNKYTFIELPTGLGKSITGMMLAEIVLESDKK